MFQGIFKQSKRFHKESKIDKILWFLENYLPQKKTRAIRKEIIMKNLNGNNNNKNQNLVFVLSKFLTINLDKNKVLFSFGNWSLPYLKILKRKGFLN